MSTAEFALQAMAMALAAAGTLLLVREVSKAHEVEEISQEMTAVRELATLYTSDVREFWIRSAMRSSNHDRATAEQMAADLGDAAIQAGAAQYNQLYTRSLPHAAQRWFELTVPAVLTKRHQDLWFGFWLLIFGLGVQLLIATGKLLGISWLVA